MCEQPGFELIDWDTLEIQESRSEEGRIEITGQDEMYASLGLRDEDERAKNTAEVAAKENAAHAGESQGSTIPLDIEGAAILVDNIISEKCYISYDEDI
ncbi:hypothetical protein C2845_PM09G22160 [Panicum miliaceum]|uniref:Uncharacterized protein n=1 Tax=Panicum miliaceum TaxID=4540 RepID=A0A3L6S2S4_PANMI|nr:hypothetical protein C2845_PM09G22160 [Panicum miliaceum]